MQTRWLFRITYLYLTIPFIIFCMGWLRLSVAIPVIVLVLWALWQLIRYPPITNYQLPITTHRATVYCLLLTGIWVFLSGVGGYAFQNWDHHWRNAVLRDLTTYSWPIVYSSPERGPVTMLVYYVGYWLPAALAGRLFGWTFANFILFLWTWLGVLLTILHLNLKLKTSLLKTALLLIFFSGMDAVGSLFFVGKYPTLWLPIQHLETWAGDLQYSSFTTQLFWVFNQAVPAWLCIALILDSNVFARRAFPPTTQSPTEEEAVHLHSRNEIKTFIWALSFFFAPLASIGLLIYLGVDWLEQIRGMIQNRFKGIRLDLLFISGVIVIISYLFFSSNTAAQERGFQALALKDALVFFLLEGGILWLLLAPLKWRDPRWAVTGILLFIMPFIQFGNGRDFVMRASIAPLFHLMLMTGETIFQKTAPRWFLVTCYSLLIIGSLTSLYEMNRSVYRTFEYYFIQDESECGCDVPSSEPVTHLDQPSAPENDHPGSLVADGIPTLKFMDDKLSKNFIANVRRSMFYQYLAPH